MPVAHAQGTRTDAACAHARDRTCGVGYRGYAGCYPASVAPAAVPPEPPRPPPIVLLHVFRNPFSRLVSAFQWCTTDAPEGWRLSALLDGAGEMRDQLCEMLKAAGNPRAGTEP